MCAVVVLLKVALVSAASMRQGMPACDWGGYTKDLYEEPWSGTVLYTVGQRNSPHSHYLEENKKILQCTDSYNLFHTQIHACKT